MLPRELCPFKAVDRGGLNLCAKTLSLDQKLICDFFSGTTFHSSDKVWIFSIVTIVPLKKHILFFENSQSFLGWIKRPSQAVHLKKKKKQLLSGKLSFSSLALRAVAKFKVACGNDGIVLWRSVLIRGRGWCQWFCWKKILTANCLPPEN